MKNKLLLRILMSMIIISTIFTSVGPAFMSVSATNVNKVIEKKDISKEGVEHAQNQSEVEGNVAEKETDKILPDQSTGKEEENKLEENETKEESKLEGNETKEESKLEGNETKEESKLEENETKEEKEEKPSIEEKEEYITEDDLIYSDKYLVKGKGIYRIDPKTEIKEFKNNIEIAEGNEIKIYKEETEIKSGYIGTGMKIKGTNGEEYTISVIGDITGDGLANQIELTMIIRHLVGLKDWRLEGIKAESADITGDGYINLVDISKLINYIVYGKWEYEAISAPVAPTIKVITKKEEKAEYYIEKVEIKIEADPNTKDGKTTYKITGNKEQKETEIKENETIVIEGEGEYLVTAYTYGKEGNRSRAANRVVKIKDKYTVAYKPGEEGLFSEEKTEGIKYGELTPKFKGEIKAVPGYMFIGWEPKVEEKVTKSIEYIAKWEKIEYTISFGPNGGSFTMPSEGNAKISTGITEKNTEENENNKLEYVWSKNADKAPEEGWKELTNGDKIEKTDIVEPGTWYVWIKVTDEDGNVVKIIRSDPFIITGDKDEANQIKLIPDKTEWTNEDVTVTVNFGANLTENRKITCSGSEETDYVVNGVESITIKTNEKIVTVEAEDIAGNKVIATLKISNIDKLLPEVTLSPNGGEGYAMPSEGKAKISTVLTAIDSAETEASGQSTLNTLEYAWSTSNTQEPKEWEEFTNGSKIEKADIQEAGTWYLWTKVTDKAGNRAEIVKVSNPFTITANTAEANKITLLPNKTEWTNEDVTVTVNFGANLTENRKITCSGSEETDYVVNGVESITIKTNEKIVTIEAEDIAGNKVIATLKISNIDKLLPEVTLSPNGGEGYTMPSEGNAKISTVLSAIDPAETEASGQSTLNTLEYAWSTSNTQEPEEWEEFTNGSKIEKADIQEAGTWYLWTKVTDKAGNRAEIVKVSNPFIITDSNAEENKITLSPGKTEWTNEDVIVTVSYGANLTENRKITCTGSKETDYAVNGTENIVIKTNNKTVTVEAEDIAGNKVVTTLTISNIDKALPTVDLSQNGGSFTMPSSGKAKISTTLTAEDPKQTESNGQSGLNTIQYAWSQSKDREPSTWTNFTNGSKIEKADIQEEGTWYLWTKVTDVAGNRAEIVKVSNPFRVGSNTDVANRIILTADKTAWTNEDVTVTAIYGANLIQNKKVASSGVEGTDYIVNSTESIVIKTNNKVVTAEAEDVAGNKVVTTLSILNIDKILPEVSLSPNGGTKYAMPTTGNAKISTVLSAIDPAATEASGQSKLNTISYAWSTSNTQEPEEWEEFTNGSKVEKADIQKAGTWYLWTKVTDKAGNRAEIVKVSNPFRVGSNGDEANQIKLIADKTEWTNQDVTIIVSYGENLTENRKITCTGTEGTDYTINGAESIVVKTNDKVVTIEAEDIAGNKVVATYNVTIIDKAKPTVALEPNGGSYAMPSEGNAKISTVLSAIDPAATEASGQSTLNILEYAWSTSNTQEPEEWEEFTNGSKIEKADIQEAGTWYLWTKVTDVAGNRAEIVKVSNAFRVGSNGDEANKIALTPDKAEWTNEDVEVEIKIGANLTQNKKIICTGEEGKDYIINEEENKVIVKTNNQRIRVEVEDIAGNKVEATLNIANIDKLLPTVTITPNGRTNYVMPTAGNAKISTSLTAQDAEKTETYGQSGLATLQYAWSKSNTVEPATWTEFTNGSKIEKTDIAEPGTWYLWTKVIDKAGNRAESIKVSNQFVVGSNTDPENQITLTPDITEWTNTDVIVTANYGENLSENRTLTCSGTEGTDYTKNGIENVIVKENEKTVRATAEDIEGNEVVVTLTVKNIDKIEPTVEMEPNKGIYTMPSVGTAKLNTIVTAEDLGGSELCSLEYVWDKNEMTVPKTGWKTFENGGKAEITGLTEPGTWYLWVKIRDNAGNWSRTVKSKEFVVTPNTDPANQITLTQTPEAGTWTNGNVTVTASYGANLTGAKKITCTGTVNTDYTINGSASAEIKTNGQTVTVTAEDAAGNVITKTLEITNIDKEEPTITVSPASGDYAKSRNITITVKDTGGSGLNSSNNLQYYLSTSSSALSGGAWTTYTSGTAFTIGTNLTGTYYLFVRRRNDVAGNVSTTSGTSTTINEVAYQRFGTYKFDNTKPTVNASVLTTWTTGNKVVTVSGEDSDSGVVGYYVGTTNSTPAVTASGWSTTTTYSKGVGSYYVWAKDKVGNVSEKKQVEVKNIDTTVPEIVLSANSNTTWSKTASVTVTLKDNESGLATGAVVQYGWSTSNTTAPTSYTTATISSYSAGAKTATFTATKNTETGKFYLWVKPTTLKNVAGGSQSSTTKSTGTFYIDNTAPTVDATVPTTWTTGNKTITVSGADSNSGIAGYYVGTTNSTPAVTASGWSTTTTYSKEAGTYYVWAKDKVGNISEKKQVEVKNIDTTAPEIELSANKNTTWSKTASVKVTLKDNESGLATGAAVQYGWSTSNTTAPTSYKTATISSYSAGAKTATFTATKNTETGKFYLWVKPETLKNVAGGTQSSTTNSTGTFYIDNTAPTMNSLEATTISWTKNDVTLTGKATDTDSGIVAYQFSQTSNLTASSGGWTSITATTSQITKTYTASSTGTWYFYVKDAVENVSKKSIDIKIDKSEPTVSASPSTGAPSPAVAGNSVSVTLEDTGGSGLSGWNYSTSSTTPTSWLSTTSTSFTPTYTTSSDQTYYVFVKDVAGNVNSTSIAVKPARWENTSKDSNKYYNTMASAFSSATSGDTMTLLTSYTDTSAPTVTSGKTVIADIGTYILTKNTNTIKVDSGGTLNLKGSGTIKTSSTNMSLITNGGTLNLGSPTGQNNYSFNGTLSNENTTTNHSYYVINNSGTVYNGGWSDGYKILGQKGTAIYNSSSGKVTLEGDGTTISSTGKNAINNAGTVSYKGNYSTVTSSTLKEYATINNTGTLTINGGTISSTHYVSILNNNGGQVKVTGGTISSTADNAIWNKDNTHTNSSNPAVHITGGKLQVDLNNGSLLAVIANWADGYIYITGGTFTRNGSGNVFNIDRGNGRIYITSGTIIHNGQNGHVFNISEGYTGTGSIEMTKGTIKYYDLENRKNELLPSDMANKITVGAAVVHSQN